MAIFRMILLERAARRHLEVSEAAARLNQSPRAIPPQTAVQTRKELEGFGAEKLLWADYVARLSLEG